MEDTGSSDQTEEPIKKPSPPRRTRFIRYIKRQLHKRRAKKQEESATDRAARLTAKATIWMAVFTVILAAVSGGTLLVLKNQLKEMHEGGIDTHSLADATGKMKDSAEKSAQASRDFADTAQDISGDINEAVKKLDAQAKAIETSRKTSEANSKQALDAAISQSRLDERGWAGVGNPSFVINTKDPLKAETRVVLLGKSPAVDIVTRMGFRPFLANHVLQESDLILDTREIHNGTGFPGSSFPIRETASDPISPEEKMLVEQILEKKSILYFFGEIKYRDIFNLSHWTHFCYAITTNNSSEATPCAIYNDSDTDGKAKAN